MVPANSMKKIDKQVNDLNLTQREMAMIRDGNLSSDPAAILAFRKKQKMGNIG